MTHTASQASEDRSVLRRNPNDGKDGRGRIAAAPAILHYGFRPFFLLAALYAGLAVPVWLWLFREGLVPAGPFSGIDWHIHEMLFGYLAAVIAGFILTAVPNWTGRLPLSGLPLGILAGLWLVGRIACAAIADPVAAMVLDLAFPVALAAAIWREVLAGRNWRNTPVATLLTLFALANAAHHAQGMDLVRDGLAVHLALGVAIMLMTLIGGRIVPSFTRNWLVKQGHKSLPAPFGGLDKAALAVTVIAVIAWLAAPEAAVAGYVLLAAGAALAARLARWRGAATWRAPIVAILHLGYAWLALSVALLGLAVVWSGMPPSAALHALTAGAVGTMTLAVMTRASLGHSGRAIAAGPATIAIYAAVNLGAALRVAAPFAGDHHVDMLTVSGMVWSAAFLLFAAAYGPMLWRARPAPS